MPTFTASQLEEIGVQIFKAVGTGEAIAREVVQSLVLSNLLGVDSHGVMRIPNYLDAISAGWTEPNAEPEVVRENEVAAVMHGNNAFGQVAARRAMLTAIGKARKQSIGAASFTDIYHIGRLGEWAALASSENLIGLVIANGSRPGGLMAPYGARQKMLGTNPLAFAIPAGTFPPLLADFSTAAVAEGKIRISFHKGESIPAGWIIDSQGRATTNPGDLYEEGAILPFGDYKGYALALMVEVLGGILSGADTPIFPDWGRMHNGVFMLAIEPTFFRPGEDYSKAVDFLFSAVKQALPAHGMDGALIPGEPERKRKAEREKNGVPVHNKTWQDIKVAAQNIGIDLTS